MIALQWQQTGSKNQKPTNEEIYKKEKFKIAQKSLTDSFQNHTDDGACH